MYVSLTDKRLMAIESLIMKMPINVYLYIYFSRPLMDVYLRSHCCEFGFKKKRLQQILKNYFKQQSQIYLLKINLIACSCFYFYIFVFKFLIKSCVHIFFFISGFIQGEMGLTHGESTYRI